MENEKELREALAKVGDVDIILSHVPPYEALDESKPNEKLKLPGGHVGSKILRKFIEDKQPKLVICGHLHVPGETMIGKTRIINPGEKKLVECF